MKKLSCLILAGLAAVLLTAPAQAFHHGAQAFRSGFHGYHNYGGQAFRFNPGYYSYRQTLVFPGMAAPPVYYVPPAPIVVQPPPVYVAPPAAPAIVLPPQSYSVQPPAAPEQAPQQCQAPAQPLTVQAPTVLRESFSYQQSLQAQADPACQPGAALSSASPQRAALLRSAALERVYHSHSTQALRLAQQASPYANALVSRRRVAISVGAPTPFRAPLVAVQAPGVNVQIGRRPLLRRAPVVVSQSPGLAIQAPGVGGTTVIRRGLLGRTIIRQR